MILEKVMKLDVLEKISKMVERPINQIDKADKYKKWLKEIGFRQLDMGTNRQIFVHDKYPKVVFKIALDEQGLLDNLNEYEKSDKSKYFPMSHDIDKDGYVLVQQRVPVIDRAEFIEKDIRKQVRSILKELDKDGFVLVDLGSDKHKNFGLDKNGDIYIIDFGYVEYKSIANFNCPHIRYGRDGGKKYCKGTLDYNKEFTMLQCDECENVFTVDTVLEGYTQTRYDIQKEKDKPFEVSDELRSFYKRFTKTRDRSTLTEYVEISNKPNSHNQHHQMAEEKEETNMAKSPKDILLSKLSKRTSQPIQETRPKTLSEQLKKSDEDEIEDVFDTVFVDKEDDTDVVTVDSTPQSTEVYTVDPSPEIHDPELEDEIKEDMANGDYQLAARKLRALGSPDDEAAEMIEALFFERNPGLREVVENHRNGYKEILHKDEMVIPDKMFDGNIETENVMGDKKPNEVDRDFIEYGRILKENGIHIVESPDTNEIHVGIVIEDLVSSPVLVASKDGLVFYIDIKEHIDRLYASREVRENSEIGSDWIVTHMSSLPVAIFNKDYDEWYDESDHED